MATPYTVPVGRPTTTIPDPDFALAGSPSFWGKVTTWASENKAVVYTIAGVAVVVTGAGVAYYLTDSV